MPTGLVKLVALFLLVVHGAMGSVSGRVVCIQLWECEDHHAHLDGHAHHDSPCADDCCDHDPHHPASTAQLPDEPCCGHLHLPIPDDRQGPGDARTADATLRALMLPAAETIARWHPDLPGAIKPCSRPPDACATSQARSIKSTRLLI